MRIDSNCIWPFSNLLSELQNVFSSLWLPYLGQCFSHTQVTSVFTEQFFLFDIIFYRPGIKTWESLKTVLEQSKIGAQGSFIRRKIIPQVNWVHFNLLQFFLLISRWRNFTKEPMNVRWTDNLLCLSSSNLPISVISLSSVLCVNSTARNV